MPGNDDLYKGFEMFREGMAQYHTTQAVNDATEKLKELNSQEMDRQQQLVANQQVGNELALRLTAAGAKPEQIQAATQGLLPSASSVYQMEGQKQEGAASRQHESGEKALDRDLQRELNRGKMELLTGKGAEKLAKFKTARMDKFDSRVKADITSLQNLGSLKEVMNASDNPTGANLVRYGLLAAAGAKPISEEEFTKADANASWRKKIANRLSIEFTDKELSSSKAFYNKTVNILETRAKERLKQQIKGEATSLNQVAPEIDANEFASALESRYGNVLNEQKAKVEKSRQYSKTLNQTRILYSDNTSKVVPGRQVK